MHTGASCCQGRSQLPALLCSVWSSALGSGGLGICAGRRRALGSVLGRVTLRPVRAGCLLHRQDTATPNTSSRSGQNKAGCGEATSSQAHCGLWSTVPCGLCCHHSLLLLSRRSTDYGLNTRERDEVPIKLYSQQRQGASLPGLVPDTNHKGASLRKLAGPGPGRINARSRRH